MDNRVVVYLTLVSNGINSADAVKFSKLETMTNEEMLTECNNMITLLETSIYRLVNLKNKILNK